MWRCRLCVRYDIGNSHKQRVHLAPQNGSDIKGFLQKSPFGCQQHASHPLRLHQASSTHTRPNHLNPCGQPVEAGNSLAAAGSKHSSCKLHQAYRLQSQGKPNSSTCAPYLFSDSLGWQEIWFFFPEAAISQAASGTAQAGPPKALPALPQCVGMSTCFEPIAVPVSPLLAVWMQRHAWVRRSGNGVKLSSNTYLNNAFQLWVEYYMTWTLIEHFSETGGCDRPAIHCAHAGHNARCPMQCEDNGDSS